VVYNECGCILEQAEVMIFAAGLSACGLPRIQLFPSFIS
jgi:hypothetical protein